MKKIGKFFSNVFKEVKKVRWPNKKEMAKYSGAVLICILVLSFFFVGSDLLIATVKTLVEGL